MTACLLTMTTPSRDIAYRLSGTLTELMDPAPDAVSVFEAGGGWQVDAYFATPPEGDPGRFTNALFETAAATPETVLWGDVPDKNWVAISQSALPPVWAGRFCVHGSHDRHRLPLGPWAIEIDAGEAFGTAHHATTFGCLEAISQLQARAAPRRVLDLGTGSGVLAIAVARRFPGARIIASDLDRDSVRVAADNVAKNRAARQVACLEADGIPRVHGRTTYDVVIANILAGPLITLAAGIATALRPGGILILSGILNPQAASVLAAYHAHGLATRHHARIEGWSTLTLQKRSGRKRSGQRKPPRPDGDLD